MECPHLPHSLQLGLPHGGNGGCEWSCPAQAGLQESSVPGLVSPPLPLQALPAPSPQLPPHSGEEAREGGREEGGSGLLGTSPSRRPVPLEGDSRKEAGLSGALSGGGGQRGTNTKADEVPWRLLQALNRLCFSFCPHHPFR